VSLQKVGCTLAVWRLSSAAIYADFTQKTVSRITVFVNQLRRIPPSGRWIRAVPTTTTTLTPAFVLRTHAYGESDRIVTFITEDFGKVSGIAKGAMRSRRRFVNTLEPFVKVRLTFRARPRSDLAFVERCDILDVFLQFGSDLDRFACGSYVLELTDKMVMGREPGAEIFHLVETTLSALDAHGPSPSIIRAFELHMLGLAGYRPTLGVCCACGTTADRLRSALLVPSRGGAMCGQCHPIVGDPNELAGATLAVLADLQEHPIDAAVTRTITHAAAAEGALETLISHVINRPLRSRAILSALRQPASAC
jgi:DNA repair protein RecO (recombination protein O)